MAYTPTEWKDHIVEHPNRYRVVDNGDGTVDILDEHGAVIQQGTPVDATRLNKIEQGIKDAHDAIASHLNDFTKLQFGNRPYISMESKAYYIDAENGSDENDGLSPSTAFKTIDAALSKIPYLIFHTISLNVIGTVYLNQDLFLDFIRVVDGSFYFSGLNDGKILGGRIILRDCIGGRYENFQIKDLTVSGVFAYSTINIILDNLTFDQATDYRCINANTSILQVRNSNFGTETSDTAISSEHGSVIVSNNNAGTAREYGLRANTGGTIIKIGKQPTGLVANESAVQGGEIK